MSNQTVVEAVVMSKTKTYDFDNYSLNVSGDPLRGGRTARISVPILDDKKQRVDVCNVTISGEAFNEFWKSFVSDKQIVDVVLKKQGIASPDLSSIDDAILNKVEEKKG